MPKFANVVTIEVVPGRRDQVVALLAAHKARLKSEPGTLQSEVLLPKDDRDAAAFEAHLTGTFRRHFALGHVWTAPWQELSDVSAALVGCGHVSGLLMRRMCHWP